MGSAEWTTRALRSDLLQRHRQQIGRSVCRLPRKLRRITMADLDIVRNPVSLAMSSDANVTATQWMLGHASDEARRVAILFDGTSKALRRHSMTLVGT